MFDRVLVANRGEVAVRISRSLRALGIVSVGVFSDADATAMHVYTTDVAVRLGPAEASRSYLSIPALLEAARTTGAEAIHPGYGFLSENAEFARACADAGLVFIGPSPEAIELMGDKAQAKTLAARVGVPTLAGLGVDAAAAGEITAFCQEHGFRVLIKAVAGGGGKGMRAIASAAELEPALAAARREALAAFGDGRLMLEPHVAAPRHIEVQVVGDKYGNYIHVGERDCSLQRRHQKVVEEAPAASLDASTRERMCIAALDLARVCGYEGVGTVEFLVPQAGSGEFFFLEMNTRLQVEHPVTELVSGLDLVELQIRIAAGEELCVEQQDVVLAGHAIEARLYAENPAAGFLPASGRVLLWNAPEMEGLRIDRGVEGASEVPTYYDPLLAKLITHGPDRATALRRLDLALAGLTILGVRTNQLFLRRLLERPETQAGEVDTGLIERCLPELDLSVPEDLRLCAALEGLLVQEERVGSAGTVPVGWRSSGASAPLRVRLLDDAHRLSDVCVWGASDDATIDIGSGALAATVRRLEPGFIQAEVDKVARRYGIARSGDELWVARDALVAVFQAIAERPSDHGDDTGPLEAPMPAQVVVVNVKSGDSVAAGDVLLVLESMKMEFPVIAPHAGVVAELTLIVGDRVELGQPLASVTPHDPAERQ
jgi:acetyl-CoA/propionyl-CoA carboxylase biotin carboxyl carrier protein